MKNILIIFFFLVFNSSAFSQISDEMTIEELIEKGDEFCRDKGDFENGILFYDRAIALDSENILVYQKRAFAYFASRDFIKADKEFTFIISKNTDDLADMYFMRGLSRSLFEVEDVDGACKDFRKAKELGYDTKSLNGLNEYCNTTDLED